MRCSRCQGENDAGARFCGIAARGFRRPARAVAPRHAGQEVLSVLRRRAHTEPADRFASPESYTPKHIAEKILTSKAALEGERKQVTVLFADLKGSMELLADRVHEKRASSSTRCSSG